MAEDYSKTQKIEKYKRELIRNYMILMAVVLFIFAIIFNFFIEDKIMAWYTAGGLFLLVYSFIIIRRNYSINILVHSYIIIATIYDFYIMLAFWNNSVASFVWLIPIPLAAYVFFTRKYVILYSIFVLFCIISGFLISNYFDFNFIKHSTDDIKITDTILVLSNVAVISLIIYYKDKIRKVEVYHEIKEKYKTESKFVTHAENELPVHDELFDRIELVMKEKKLFKDVNFNISKLSAELEVNNSYISKSIRNQGYSNFNNYLNLYRINCVKKLLQENDLEKVTLMYIYTEAGFSNQSTFNRVFKQIEKITPSEYIQNTPTSAAPY